jgi:hypothetical protein
VILGGNLLNLKGGGTRVAAVRQQDAAPREVPEEGRVR